MQIIKEGSESLRVQRNLNADQTKEEKQATKELLLAGAWGFQLKIVNKKYDVYEDGELVEAQFDTIEDAARYCKLVNTVTRYHRPEVLDDDPEDLPVFDPDRKHSRFERPSLSERGYICVKNDPDFISNLRELSQYNVDVKGDTVHAGNGRLQDVVFLKPQDGAAKNFIEKTFKKYAPKQYTRNTSIADIPRGGNPWKNAHEFRKEVADYADSNRSYNESSDVFKTLDKIYEEEILNSSGINKVSQQ